jgi:hypothetical protein
MTFSKAQQEFQIRYYWWATAEFEREIHESCPNLRLFKAGPISQLYQFMRRIDRGKQLVLAHGLLKRFHPDAVRALAQSCSAEESALRDEFDEFGRKADVREAGTSAKRCAGKTIKFVSKRKLRQMMVSKFVETYGSRCIRMEIGEEWDPLFFIKCCGWVISTQLYFGRRESVIDYSHSVESETRLHHAADPRFSVAALKLEQRISFAAWLGICSVTQWQYLTNDDVEPASDAVIRLCGHFFEVASKLLKGLEFDKLTGE